MNSPFELSISKLKTIRYPALIGQIVILVCGIVLFFPHLGKVHLFDWDEINFAEAAREMLVSKNYLTVQINYLPFWEKPPLFIWMQALSMNLFGVNEFAARFPNAVCGLVTLSVLFHLGRKLKGIRFGLLWTLVYAGSVLPFFYFNSGIIDPWFNFFIFLGIHFFIYYTDAAEKVRVRFLIFSACCIGFAMLTKGPVGLLLFMVTACCFWIGTRLNKLMFFKKKVHSAEHIETQVLPIIFKVPLKHIVLFLSISGFIGGLWYILLAVSGHFSILLDFINYQIRLLKEEDAGHGGFLLYHFIILFIGVFPSSVFCVAQLFKRNETDILHKRYIQVMKILLWTVLIIFTIVKTKIVHYSSLAYFPISFLSAVFIDDALSNKVQIKRRVKIALISIAALFSLCALAVPLIDTFKDKIIRSGVIKDVFAVGNLQAQVKWTGFEFLIGVLFFISACVSVYYMKQKYKQIGIYLIFPATVLFTYFTMDFVVPNIEAYSQNAMITFYIEKSAEDCYAEPMGFYSYAQLFYFKKQAHFNTKSRSSDWLLKGDIDKSCYFVCKNYNVNEFYSSNPQVIKLYEKNGYVFFKRAPAVPEK